MIGDRWSFLIVLDALLDTTRFEDFHERLGIARNILTDRLVSLVRDDIFTKRLYQRDPDRYEYILTERGKDLFASVMLLIRWGDEWISEGRSKGLILVHRRCRNPTMPRYVCEHCKMEIRVNDVDYRDGPGAGFNGEHRPMQPHRSDSSAEVATRKHLHAHHRPR